jgi:pre-rRNA-processing protein TSR4
VYAPVEADRTLYVFGCNSVACTENPGSWRVLRDQVEPAKETPVNPSVTEVEEVEGQVDKLKLAWGSDSDGSDWSDDEDDSKPQAPAVDLVDLEALLQQRDDAMMTSANTTKSKPAPKKAGSVKESAFPSNQNAFPALPIEVINEPYEDYTAEHDYAHENKLLEQYMKQEEEEKSTDVGDLRSVITNLKKKGDTAKASGGAASAGESYEKTPAAQRHLLRFQQRISRCPLQCLRYDYGGEPLWPVVTPQNLKIPHCPGCGEERAFEMQLTPTINYFLKVDEYAAADSASQAPPAANEGATDASKAAVVPPGGMDWLSLIVYSCSASCAQSHEEFVYVVPSPTS